MKNINMKTHEANVGSDARLRWMAKIAEAGDPSTPPSRLYDLAQDDDLSVVAAVARNPRAPADVLARLAGHDNDVVAYAAAFNLSTPWHAVEKWKWRRGVKPRFQIPEQWEDDINGSPVKEAIGM